MEGDVLTTQEIFLFERTGLGEDGRVRGRFRATGIRPKCAEKILASGRHLASDMFDHVKAVA
jgi:pilus assembly protein CpaF